MINIHDKFFKEMLSDKGRAIQFLRNFVPAEISEVLDFESITYSKTSYIVEDLEEVFSDLVLEANLNGGEGVEVSILLEHKSYKDENVLFQLMHYLSSGYREQVKQGRERKPIIPIIIYNGKSRWEVGETGDSFMHHPQVLREYVPAFSTIFIEIGIFTDEELGGIADGMLQAALIAQGMRAYPKLLEENIERVLSMIDDIGDRNFVKSILVYIFEITEIEKGDLQSIVLNIEEPLKTLSMTTYDFVKEQYWNRGMEKGIEKGLEKGMKLGETKGVNSVLKKLVISCKKKGFENEKIAELLEISEGEVLDFLNEN